MCYLSAGCVYLSECVCLTVTVSKCSLIYVCSNYGYAPLSVCVCVCLSEASLALYVTSCHIRYQASMTVAMLDGTLFASFTCECEWLCECVRLSVPRLVQRDFASFALCRVFCYATVRIIIRLFVRAKLCSVCPTLALFRYTCVC